MGSKRAGATILALSLAAIGALFLIPSPAKAYTPLPLFYTHDIGTTNPFYDVFYDIQENRDFFELSASINGVTITPGAPIEVDLSVPFTLHAQFTAHPPETYAPYYDIPLDFDAVLNGAPMRMTIFKGEVGAATSQHTLFLANGATEVDFEFQPGNAWVYEPGHYFIAFYPDYWSPAYQVPGLGPDELCNGDPSSPDCTLPLLEIRKFFNFLYEGIQRNGFYLPQNGDLPPLMYGLLEFEIVAPDSEPTCCSSVLFLPGIEGSALEEGGDLRWPPSLWSQDVARLELTDEGESVNEVKVLGVLGNFYPSTNLYGGFATFMDTLATINPETGTSTIEAWVPFAYDWRYSPEKILEDGVSTPEGVVDLVQTVEMLAEGSKSEKVTIVAHSMGGLLGKALIRKLQEQGKENLIDNFVMVGTPQLGTPQAVATLLHGDQPIALELFVRSHILRSVAQNMPSAYDLLPGEKYFSDIVSPVVSFDPNASYTEPWRNRWKETLDTYDEFEEFLTGTGVPRSHPSITDLGSPEVVNPKLLASSTVLHSDIDTYDIPAHIRVVQIAGWGLPTTKTIMYWNSHLLGLPTPLQGYKSVPTVEGDDTVVYPSAISLFSKESYFFNLAAFNALENTPDYSHKDLLNADQIQSALRTIIEGEEVLETTYILDELPNISEIPEQLLIITRSPVILGVYDSEDNLTGIDPSQDLDSETLSVTKDIPSSSFLSSGEDQYIFVPKEGTYTVGYRGIGSGPTTVEIANFSNDEETLLHAFIDIPTTSETSATFIVDSEAPENTDLKLDIDSDGFVDYLLPASEDGVTVFPQTPVSFWSGFQQPIDDPSIVPNIGLSVFKAGSTVPVKFQLRDVNGQVIQTGTAPVWLSPVRKGVLTSNVDETVYTDLPTSGSYFRFDPISQQYIYNWKTKVLTPGYWYKISVELEDGTIHSVVVGLK